MVKKYALTFTLNLETWVKVIAHPLPKNSVYVKHDPDKSKGRVNMI